MVGDEKCNYLFKENLEFFFRRDEEREAVSIDTVKIDESPCKILQVIDVSVPDILVFGHLESNREPVGLLKDIVKESSELPVIAMAEYGSIRNDFSHILERNSGDMFRKAVAPLFPNELYTIINEIFRKEEEKKELLFFNQLLRNLSYFIDQRDTFSPNKPGEGHVRSVQRLVDVINNEFLGGEFDNEELQLYSMSHDISRITSLNHYSIDEIELIPDNYDKIAKGLFHLDSVETNSGHYYQCSKERNEFNLRGLVSAVDLYTNLTTKTSKRGRWSHEDAIDYIEKDKAVTPALKILNTLKQLKPKLN